MASRNHTEGPAHRTMQRGFTLVELLVVIGIIAVLIGILLPALGRARASANSVACMANLRSIGQAIAIYTVQSKGMLPPGWFDGCINGVTDPNSPAAQATAAKWPSILMATINSKYGATYLESKSSGSDTAKLREMFFCPEVPGIRMENANGNTHYVCHPRLMPTVGDDNQGKQWYSAGFGGFKASLPYKVGKVKRAAEIAIIFDGTLQYDITNNAYRPAYDVPIGACIDNYTYPGAGGTWLLEPRMAALGKSMEDSVDMTPIGGTNTTPNVDGVGNPANAGSYVNIQNIRFRHMKNTVANALMVDGHCESFHFNPRLPANDKRVTDFKRKNIHINP
jgi:prepilin-type N-terminal cleavage/methylation domain-containing protein/prepilin-type processing-associated H-X9-DG protein